jgi:hypothetical protein
LSEKKEIFQLFNTNPKLAEEKIKIDIPWLKEIQTSSDKWFQINSNHTETNNEQIAIESGIIPTVLSQNCNISEVLKMDSKDFVSSMYSLNISLLVSIVLTLIYI